MKNLTLIFVLFISFCFAEQIFFDDFEGENLWELSGEFEIGQPDSLGGEYGSADPANAFDGVNVLGSDLTGLGTYPGDYEPNLADDDYLAISPSINCGNYYDINLSFQKWLNVETNTYDHAKILISLNDGESFSTLWENSTTMIESEWSQFSLDISELASACSTLRIAFSIGGTDGSWQYSGWNIDAFSITGTLNPNVSISGIITGAGLPIDNASVSVDGYEILTNEAGEFSIETFPGEREFRVSADTFYNYRQLINVENEAIDINVNLQLLKTPINLSSHILNLGEVELFWEFDEVSLEEAYGYNIYRDSFMVNTVYSPQLSFVDIVPISGTYDYSVSALYASGESALSDSLTIFLPLYEIIPPHNLHFYIEESNAVILWEHDDNENVTSFNLYRNEELISELMQYSFIDSALTDGDYNYFVTSSYGEQESSPSESITISIVSNEEEIILMQKEGIYSISPSPFNPVGNSRNNLQIKYFAQQKDRVSYEIYNLKGQRIFSQKELNVEKGINLFEWNGRDFQRNLVANGVFFLKINSSKITDFRKIIILK